MLIIFMVLSDILPTLVTVFGVLMNVGLFFQFRKIVKRKSSNDISLAYYSVLLPGSALWLVYGIYLDNVPLIVGNIVGVSGVLAVLLAALAYRKVE